MRNKINIFRNFIVVAFVASFIIAYFLFLINLYIIPNNYELPIVSLIGFAIIIIGIFYFFINLSHGNESNETLFNFKILNENSIKIILMSLMVITFFIPPISFSDAMINWEHIGFFNHFRAIIFLIGGAFLPGSCIFKILLPNSTLHEKFHVEPFLLKITIYPLLSFTFLGCYTFILDQIGLLREFFAIVLFITIVLLFVFDFLIQKLRDNDEIKLNTTELKLSKYTSLIIFLALGIIIIALGIFFTSEYGMPGDSWRGIEYAYYIGRQKTIYLAKFYGSYTVYWGYISFSLSTLCGIPYFNVYAILFLFLYLIITSIYLLMKALLHRFKEIYAVLSTIFIITFSNLFYIVNSSLGGVGATFVGAGIFSFYFRSYAFFSLLLSIALFIIIVKPSNVLKNKPNFKTERFIVTFFAALFLLQSYMTYFFPAIAGISLTFIYCIFSNKKSQDFKLFLKFLLIFILLFISIDVLSGFFFSWIPSLFLSGFLDITLLTQQKFLFLNAIFIYLFLLVFFVLNFLVYRIYIKVFLKNKKRDSKFKINSKTTFKVIIFIFSEFLIIEILHIIVIKIMEPFLVINKNFFTFYLDLIFAGIGLIGILGIYLSYFCFKKNRQLFYVLFSWCLFTIGIASILIFRRWIQYPFTPVTEIPSNESFYMMYWYSRNWYYLIIPLSIFSSIGLIKLIKRLKSKRLIKDLNKTKKLIPYLIFISSLIFLSFSNTLIAGLKIYNRGIYDRDFHVKDEEAQMFGWVTENIPRDSKILIDRYQMYHLRDMGPFNIYFIELEIKEACDNFYYGCQYGWEITYEFDLNCSIEYVEELDGHESILNFNAQNNNGSASVDIKFNSAREYGSIEFFIRTTNKSKLFEIDFSSSENTTGISFSINSNAFCYYNGSSFNKILDIENDTWYPLKFDFECTNGNYTGLSQYNWKTTINGTDYGEFKFLNNLSQVENMKLASGLNDYGWNTSLDAFNFSWEPFYNIDNCILNLPLVINHLKTNNIQYFILDLNNSELYRDLISTFYKRKLYEYRDLAIYTSHY